MPNVFKISLPGIDVHEATPEQCSLHSGFNSPKIDSTKDSFLNVNITFDNEPPDPVPIGSLIVSLRTDIYTISHPYRYTPMIWLHSDYATDFDTTIIDRYGPGIILLYYRGANATATLDAEADDKNITIYVTKSWRGIGDPPTLEGRRVQTRLYIFADQAF